MWVVPVTMRTLLRDIWGAMGVPQGLCWSLRALMSFMKEPKDFGFTLRLYGGVSRIMGALPGIVGTSEDFRDTPEVCGPLNTRGRGVVRAP